MLHLHFLPLHKNEIRYEHCHLALAMSLGARVCTALTGWGSHCVKFLDDISPGFYRVRLTRKINT